MLLQSTAKVVKKLLVDDKYKLKQIYLLKTVSGKTFCFLEKCILVIFKFCPLSNLMFFFLRAADWSSTNFLGMYCYLNVILINFVYCGPGYSSHTVNGVLESQSVDQIKR